MRFILLAFLVVMGLGVVAQQADLTERPDCLYMLHKRSQRIVRDYNQGRQTFVVLKNDSIIKGLLTLNNKSSVFVGPDSVNFDDIFSINRKIVQPNKYRLFAGSDNEFQARKEAIKLFKNTDDSIHKAYMHSLHPADRVYLGIDLLKIFTPSLTGRLELYFGGNFGMHIEGGRKFKGFLGVLNLNEDKLGGLKYFSPGYRVCFGPQYFFRTKWANFPFFFGLSLKYKRQDVSDIYQSSYNWDHELDGEYLYSINRKVYGLAVRFGQTPLLPCGVSWNIDFGAFYEEGLVVKHQTFPQEAIENNSFSNIKPLFDFGLIFYLGID